MFINFFVSLLMKAPLTLYLAQADDSVTPAWVPIVIVAVLVLIFFAAIFSSSGIRNSEADMEEEPSPPEPAPEPEPEPAALPEPDDLKRIEGIGPKIQSVLADANIATFTQLAAANVADLERIVREEAGIRVAFPDTWPAQAKLAADGDWDALAQLQDDLKGGRVA